MLHFRSKPLPDLAESYLRELLASGRAQNTVSMYRAALSHFYRFLSQQRIVISQFDEQALAEFDQDLLRHNLKLVTRRANIKHIHSYLRWLEAKGELSLGFSKQLFPNYRSDVIKGQKTNLPEVAERFLVVLESISKPFTVKGYQTCLRTFYRLHQDAGKKPTDIQKNDIENFLIHLKNRGLNTNSRFRSTVQFRRYLDWLYDHKKLKVHPDILIKTSDLPKREEMLPRPFPVNVDLTIQQRLEDNGGIDFLGVLLMRRCGLRVGELRDLTLDCISQDFAGNWYLKVPLAKMNRERILPLDSKTVEIVERIKKFHPGTPEPGTSTRYLISNPTGKRRSRAHFAMVLLEVTKDLAIPGVVTLHRLRHSFATSLLSAGLSLITLKKLMGHRDIRMTLNYATITQEAVREEYFEALSKIRSKYEVASYPLKKPDLREGMNRGFYDAQKYAKKIAGDRADINPEKLKRLLGRMMALRQELSDLLK